MSGEAWYRVAADVVLTVHVGFVLFVIVALLLTLIGGVLGRLGFRGWGWVRNRWFRGAHLLAIGVVVGQAWLGLVCPLTTWEMRLRVAGGQRAYDETFMAHWLGRLLFFQAEAWVFIAAYSAFGLLVLLSLWWVPVRWRGRRGRGRGRAG